METVFMIIMRFVSHKVLFISRNVFSKIFMFENLQFNLKKIINAHSKTVHSLIILERKELQ